MAALAALRAASARRWPSRARAWRRRAAGRRRPTRSSCASSRSSTRSRAATIERLLDAAVGQRALAHLEDVAPAHQRHGLGQVHVVGVVALLAADDEDVAEARGGDQRGACALALQDGVGRNRGGVQDARRPRAGAAWRLRAVPRGPRAPLPPDRWAWSPPCGNCSTPARTSSSTKSVNVPPISNATRSIGLAGSLFAHAHSMPRLTRRCRAKQ